MPVAVSGLTGVTAIAGGNWDGYALKSDGTVWAWGWSEYGQLGNFIRSRWAPNAVNGVTRAIAIAAGGNTGYALHPDGTVVAWGDNSNGQLGVPSTVTPMCHGQLPP